jgi:flagellin-specific chaperone FliS
MDDISGDESNINPAVRNLSGMSQPDPIERFLQQEIGSASPAKLHWMLLRRAHALSVSISDLWSKGDFAGANQWIILIRDILTELLAGIVDPKHPLARQQSDLYIFLSVLLSTAEQGRDIDALKDLREILEIEMISWEMLVERDTQRENGPSNTVQATDSGFDFSA